MLHTDIPVHMHIGAARAASTWFFSACRASGSVSRFQKKEVRFFSSQLDLNPRDYRRIAFRGLNPPGSENFVDFTPTYLTYPSALDRIAAFFSDQSVPVIPTFSAILRNPIDRAWSAYVGATSKGEVPADYTIEEASEFLRGGGKGTILESGLYAKGLQRFRAGLPEARLNVVIFETILQDPLGALANLTEGTAIRPRRWTIPATKVNASFETPILARVGRHVPTGNRVFSTFHRAIRERMGTESQGPSLSARNFLTDYYHDDILQLSEMLGVNLQSLWRAT